MDNAQKAIMIGVGLFITIIIIAAVMLITGMGQDLLNQGTAQLSGVSAQLQTQLTSQYDNVQFTGSQVLSAIQKYYSDSEMVVYINNNGTLICTTPNMISGAPTSFTIDANNTVQAGAGIAKNTTQLSYGTYTSATSTAAQRVVTTAQYKSYLIKLNGSVLGVYFVKQ
jgi:hypothetical protein